MYGPGCRLYDRTSPKRQEHNIEASNLHYTMTNLLGAGFYFLKQKRAKENPLL